MKKLLIMTGFLVSGLFSRANATAPQCPTNLTVIDGLWQECANDTLYYAGQLQCMCEYAGCELVENPTPQWVQCNTQSLDVNLVVGFLSLEIGLMVLGLVGFYFIEKVQNYENQDEEEKSQHQDFLIVSTCITLCVTGLAGFITTVATYEKQDSPVFSGAIMSTVALLTGIGLYTCNRLYPHQYSRLNMDIPLSEHKHSTEIVVRDHKHSTPIEARDFRANSFQG